MQIINGPRDKSQDSQIIQSFDTGRRTREQKERANIWINTENKIRREDKVGL